MEVTEENDLSRNLICILFPGVVKNEEKALECLGGIRTISQVAVYFYYFTPKSYPENILNVR